MSSALRPPGGYPPHVTGALEGTALGPRAARPVLLWFRRDLRLADNPALNWAARTGRPVIPVFVLDDGQPGIRPLGGASRWWLHGSLDALRTALEALGSRLILRRGAADAVLAQLARETGATDIVWNRLHDPNAVLRDKRVRARFAESGVAVRSFSAGLLFEPWTIRTGQGNPYRVFTPFWRRCLQEGFDGPGEEPPALAAPAVWPNGDELDDWGLRCSTPDWAAGLRAAWRPGEAGARMRLDAFLTEGIEGYHEDRDLPGAQGTSRLSPHLHFGEIGPRQVAGALKPLPQGPGKDAFLRELGWREFSHHLLHHNPGMATTNLRSEFDRMPWREDAAALRCWQRGRTGYPLVDAGMRELWATGWMHNRVRMVAASFLTRHLLLDWRLGEDCSGIRWSTPTGPTTASAGNGWPAAAPMRRRISASSTLSRSHATTIRREAICGHGCRNWRDCRTICSTRPGSLRPQPWRRPACGLERTIRTPWWTTPPPAGGPSTPTAGTSPPTSAETACDRHSSGARLFPRAQTADMMLRWCRVALVLEAAALSDDAPSPEGYDA